MQASPTSALSAIMLKLYRGPPSAAADHRDWALGLLEDSLPFDSAAWVSGHMTEAGLLPRHAHVFETPRQGLAPGRAGGRSHALATEISAVTTDPVTQLATAITLRRMAGRSAFSSAESELLATLVPHLAESDGGASLAALLRATHGGGDSLAGSGVADRSGLLQIAPPEFQRLLLLEWADWLPRMLPQVLARLLDGMRTARFAGKRIVVEISPMNDVFLLRAREKRPADNLSARELDIARRMAAGLTHKEVARQFGIAPDTVRSHMKSVFTKLHVRKQSEMAVALHDLD